MKLPIALATLFLAATTAVPAFAAMQAPHSTAQYQQGYRDGYNANTNAYNARAAAPRVNSQATYGWGHCVSGLTSDEASAYPSWDVCGGG